jgi:hypothetical protein
VCAYLCEAAKKGLPDWYRLRCEEKGPRGAKHNVMLKTHSRGFFGCSESAEPVPPAKRGRPVRRRRTLNERLLDCKQKASLLAVVHAFDAQGEITATSRTWLGQVSSFLIAYMICEGVIRDDDDEAWQHAWGKGSFEVDANHILNLRAQGFLTIGDGTLNLWLNRVLRNTGYAA